MRLYQNVRMHLAGAAIRSVSLRRGGRPRHEPLRHFSMPIVIVGPSPGGSLGVVLAKLVAAFPQCEHVRILGFGRTPWFGQMIIKGLFNARDDRNAQPIRALNKGVLTTLQRSTFRNRSGWHLVINPRWRHRLSGRYVDPSQSTLTDSFQISRLRRRYRHHEELDWMSDGADVGSGRIVRFDEGLWGDACSSLRDIDTTPRYFE